MCTSRPAATPEPLLPASPPSTGTSADASTPAAAPASASAGPAPAPTPAPTPAPEALQLPERERALLPSLRSTVHALVPGGLRDADLSFVTEATLARFLRARDHDVAAAGSMLARTVEFRRARGAVSVCAYCVRDPRAHSFYPIGPTTGASPDPVMYSNFAISNRDPASSTEHMIFALEALFRSDSLSKMIWVMDFHAFSRADISPANARTVLTLFADHYPERLGRAVIYGAPMIFYGLWSAVKLFAAPQTVKKVVFVRHSEADRKAKFAGVGITGQTYERLCREIDEARIPSVGAKKNWWALEPLQPLPHYGAQIMRGRV